jgi:hypothetical protein
LLDRSGRIEPPRRQERPRKKREIQREILDFISSSPLSLAALGVLAVQFPDLFAALDIFRE